MRILLDFSQIPLQKVGVGVYAINLIIKLYEIDKINKYYLLMQNDDLSFDSLKSKRFKIHYIKSKIFRNFAIRILMEQFYIPYLILKYKIKLIHSLHYSFPFITFGAKKIVTIHDLTFFLYPNLHQLIKRYYFRFFTKSALYHANKIICVSESTKKDLLKLKNVRKDKVAVIPLGKSNLYHSNYKPKVIDKVRFKYNIEREYLLFIGTIEPRKNILNLIKAYEDLINNNKNLTNLFLVITGKKGWYYKEIFKYIDKLTIKNKIIFTGFVNEEEKPLLINGCKAFIYPSFYEGFGIPVLEAIACNKPVITSNISSIPEVAGNAALYVNPYDFKDIAKGILRIINNEKTKSELINNSVKRSKIFNWENTARKTLDLYNNV